MKRQVQTTFTLVSVLALGLLIGPPAAANEPDPLLTANLAELASEMGDSNGHIAIPDRSGSQVLATYVESIEIYTRGDDIHGDEIFLTCREDSVGGFSICEKFDISAGGETEFCSDNPDGDNWCECSGILQCAVLVLSGQCTEELTCDGTGCACASN